MFTGLIAMQGVVHTVTHRRHGLRLVMVAPRAARRARVGDSLAVHGVCLTVAATTRGRLMFDVIPSTLRCTTIRSWSSGQRVHVEEPLRAGQRMHGHLLLGHVDGTARVAAVGRRGCERWLTLTLPSTLRRYCVPKGSIAIDGVSVTIATLRDGCLRVCLIPTTLRKTRLGRLAPGDRVNVETDVLIKAARGRRHSRTT